MPGPNSRYNPESVNVASLQPHQYKVVIAGNNDVFLSEPFLEEYPEQRYSETRPSKDLDWEVCNICKIARLRWSLLLATERREMMVMMMMMMIGINNRSSATKLQDP